MQSFLDSSPVMEISLLEVDRQNRTMQLRLGPLERDCESFYTPFCHSTWRSFLIFATSTPPTTVAAAIAP
jgi:hypothetical protein